MSAFTFAEPKELIFTHVVAEDTPKGKMARMFKSMIERRLGDQYKITIRNNGELMTDAAAVIAVSKGEVHFAAPSLSKFSDVTNKLQLFDLPFLFADMEALNKFQQSPAGISLLSSMTDKNIQGLGYLHNGMKQLTANQDIQLPVNIAGITFRVVESPVLRKQFETLNAQIKIVPFSDVYQALADGEVQGQENTWSNIYSKKFYEHQSHLLESNHGVLDYMIITNSDFWESIPKDQKYFFENALKVSTKYGNAMAQAKSQNDRDRILDESDILHAIPTESEKEQWREAMKPVWQSFSEELGQDLIDAALSASQ
jgi:C4-dicarboxylate-binding protein DctP